MNRREKPRCAILAISQGACALGRKLATDLEADFFPCKGKTARVFQEVWTEYQALVCIMASGIVIRSIAPLLVNKYQDPAVVVCDEQGSFVVSLLSGHLGGANALAKGIAGLTSGQAVISTASDVLGQTALDLWCRDQNLVPANKKIFTQIMGKLLNQGWLSIASDHPLPELPPDLRSIADDEDRKKAADLFITIRSTAVEHQCLLHPQSLTAGIGCNRGTAMNLIEEAVKNACQQHGLAPQSIACLASIELKQDEEGLLALAAKWSLPLFFYSAEELNQVPGISVSPAVLRHTGAKAVAEPAALLAAGSQSRLLVAKMKQNGVTVAIAERFCPFDQVS